MVPVELLTLCIVPQPVYEADRKIRRNRIVLDHGREFVASYVPNGLYKCVRATGIDRIRSVRFRVTELFIFKATVEQYASNLLPNRVEVFALMSRATYGHFK